jgi:hypothetical protein
MNPKAKGKEAYKPTQIEHYANFFTHAVSVYLAMKHFFNINMSF